MIRRPDRATTATALLSTALAVTGASVTWWSLHAGHQPAANWAMTAVVAVLFFLAEQYLVTFEFLHESHSLSFAGVPLALGALGLPVPQLVAARLLGSIVAMALQRTSAEKLCFNSAMYLCEAAVSGALVRGLLPAHGVPLQTLAVVAGWIALVDQVMTMMVLTVIRLHGGRYTWRGAGQVYGHSLVLSALATAFAVSVHVLLQQGVAGGLLAVLVTGAAVFTYRVYSRTARRHQALTLVHEFVTAGTGAGSVQDLALSSLTSIRQTLRASVVELFLPTAPASPGATADGRGLRLRVNHDDHLTSVASEIAPDDWVRSRALRRGEPALAVRGKDDAYRSWLGTVGLQDAIVVALRTGAETHGVITVGDRLTDFATFTADDLRLLQTLTSHLAVSLQSARLLETLSFDARHDSLTGLGNRAHLTHQLAAATGTTAMLLLDLDRFKEVNDVLGHDTGDHLLTVVAHRLSACLPAGTTIARLGGDEFAVLLTGLPDDAETVVAATAHRLAIAIGNPVQLADALLTPRVSVGIALTPAVAASDLLRCADTAMYAAKDAGTTFCVYTPELDSGRADRLALAADMQLALTQTPEQFSVHYQPQIDLATGAVHAAEALVRWLHPTRGTLGPDRFIPLAESSGQIDALSRHVLATALADCAAWHRRGHRLTVAVNLSARNLADDGLTAHVLQAVRDVHARPEWLTLEITESSVMQDPDGAVATLSALAQSGIGISLDDFGTGYSSLSYLQRLPVTELKIDRSFVADLDSPSGERTALFRSITALGVNLGLQIVAEGIETPAQLDTVTDLGCHVGQGYLISRPLDAVAFTEWLDRRRTAGPQHRARAVAPA